jgi:hypothetical protein
MPGLIDGEGKRRVLYRSRVGLPNRLFFVVVQKTEAHRRFQAIQAEGVRNAG